MADFGQFTPLVTCKKCKNLFDFGIIKKCSINGYCGVSNEDSSDRENFMVSNNLEVK